MSLCLSGILRHKVIATITRLNVNSSGASATILEGKKENLRHFASPHKALKTIFSPTQRSARSFWMGSHLDARDEILAF